MPLDVEYQMRESVAQLFWLQSRVRKYRRAGSLGARILGFHGQLRVHGWKDQASSERYGGISRVCREPGYLSCVHSHWRALALTPRRIRVFRHKSPSCAYRLLFATSMARWSPAFTPPISSSKTTESRNLSISTKPPSPSLSP